MAISAVFFDLDDTLCLTTATRPERARLSAEVLLPHARGLDAETLMSRMLALNAEGFPVGAISVIEALNIDDSEAAARAVGTWFFQGCEHLIRSPDGAQDVIESLAASHTLGIISNGNHDIQTNKLGALAFNHHFHAEHRVFSGTVGHAKPDPRIFQHALEQAGVEPREAVMVGDWALGDAGGAQAAGMRGVWFNPQGLDTPEGVSPDATIRSLTELLDLLQEWGA
jgi:HAD superfamily hydrolase (TIGR01549 family)